MAGEGEYGDYSANMHTDTSTKNSDLFDIKNSGKSLGERMSGKSWEEMNKGERVGSTVADLTIGGGIKMYKDLIHGRFDIPGIDYSAQAYNPYSGAGQIGTQNQQRFGQYAADASQRQGAQAQASEFRSDQDRFLGDLYARATGAAGPSVAEMQNRRNIEQQLVASQAMAAGSSDPALAARNAANMAGQAMTQGAADATALREREMQQAAQQYSGALAGARGQDQSLAIQNAQLQMQQQQQNDAMVQYYLSQGFTQDQAQQKAAMEMEQLKAEQALETQKVNAEIAMKNHEALAKNKSLGARIMGMFFGGGSM